MVKRGEVGHAQRGHDSGPKERGCSSVLRSVSALKLHYRHRQRGAATQSWVGSVRVHHFLCSTGLPEVNS